MKYRNNESQLRYRAPMSEKSLDGDVQQRLIEYVEARLKDKTQKELAREWYISQSYISTLRAGKAGGGGKILRAIALLSRVKLHKKISKFTKRNSGQVITKTCDSAMDINRVYPLPLP